MMEPIEAVRVRLCIVDPHTSHSARKLPVVAVNAMKSTMPRAGRHGARHFMQ
jgi:hypothetical protein